MEHAWLDNTDFTGADLRGVDLDRTHSFVPVHRPPNLSLARVYKRIGKSWFDAFTLKEIQSLEEIELAPEATLVGSYTEDKARAHERLDVAREELKALHARWCKGSPDAGVPDRTITAS